MKYTLRIPTKEQFAYIEVEGTDEDFAKYGRGGAIEAYEEFTKKIKEEKQETSLQDKEWKAWLDKYMTDQTGNAEQYEQMSTFQKGVIQEIKKSVARIEYPTREIKNPK